MIAADGTVTLDEFSALMISELRWHSPKQTLLSVFQIPSRTDGDSSYYNLITLDKIRGVCNEYQVVFYVFHF